ncbi:MAG TPA: metallophosphoesterase family protein [Sphingomonas sp.]|nr:metallophosphoesterase family protein [Sphingomonas sp.]
MLRKFLKSRAKPGYSIPDGERVYAIGDLHGCDDLLAKLLDLIAADDAERGPAQTTMVFLGDLVDRGPASAQVVERLRLLAQERPHTRFLKGNHEEIFLGAVEGEPKALRLFCRIGGRETVLSYGLAAERYDRLDYEEFAAELKQLVPRAHAEFLDSFEDMIVIGDYLFVHAGIRPDVELDEQRPRDLRWIRDPFLDHDKPLAKMVVHGHTISPEIDLRPHRIGVDTGAYSSGQLSALGLEGTANWTITAQ